MNDEHHCGRLCMLCGFHPGDDKSTCTPTVISIVGMALLKAGYDGLYSPEGDCACQLSCLFDRCELKEHPKNLKPLTCIPGYLIKKEEAEGQGYDFMIVPEKPEVNETGRSD